MRPAPVALIAALMLTLSFVAPQAGASPVDDCDPLDPVEYVQCAITGLGDAVCYGTLTAPEDGLTAVTPYANSLDGRAYAGFLIADGGTGQATPTGFNTYYTSFVFVGAWVALSGDHNCNQVSSNWAQYWIGQICIPDHTPCV